MPWLAALKVALLLLKQREKCLPNTLFYMSLNLTKWVRWGLSNSGREVAQGMAALGTWDFFLIFKNFTADTMWTSFKERQNYPCMLTTPSSSPASKKNHSVNLIWNGSVQNVQKKQYKCTNIHNLILQSSIIILCSSLVLKKFTSLIQSPLTFTTLYLNPSVQRGTWWLELCPRAHYQPRLPNPE